MEAYQPRSTELLVTRQVYVPADVDFTRWADRIENLSDSEQDVELFYRGGFVEWPAVVEVVYSSSGDALLDPDDDWVVVDDGLEDGGVPPMAVVWQSEDSVTKAQQVRLTNSIELNLVFNVTLPANGTGTFLLFAIQASTRDGAAALAEELYQLDGAASDELEDDLDTLINFVPGAPGAPRVRMNGPYLVAEGGELVVTASAVDAEGEQMTYEWDLDDDGSYDDLAGTLEAPVSAAAVDGPAGIRIGLRVTDATAHVVERHTTISVQNVPPVVSSAPPTVAATGQRYEYQIVATDFAADVVGYAVEEGPPGLTVDVAGLVSWTPAADGRGPDVPVVVRVYDDDGGEVEHPWTIRLSGAPFVQPGGPYRVEEGGEVVLSPIVDDAENDPITYAWDLDSDHQYDDSTEASVTWSAAGIDGPADGFQVGLVVSDGTFDVTFQIPVEVRNAAPVFTTTPPPVAVVEREWVYRPEAVDPGDDPFEITIDEEEIPLGMEMGEDGTLRWTPNVSQLETGEFAFVVTAEDEDNGRARQEVNIEVRENSPPPVPDIQYPDGSETVRTLQPTILLGNVDDPDGDPVEYYIEVDRDLCFCSADAMRSGPLAEGDLVTQWRLPSELVLGQGTEPNKFYLQRWASDGLDESDKTPSMFEVELEADVPDDDEEADRGAGCACRAAGAPLGGSGPLLPTLAVLALGLVLSRRRRAD